MNSPTSTGAMRSFLPYTNNVDSETPGQGSDRFHRLRADPAQRWASFSSSTAAVLAHTCDYQIDILRIEGVMIAEMRAYLIHQFTYMVIN